MLLNLRELIISNIIFYSYYVTKNIVNKGNIQKKSHRNLINRSSSSYIC